MSPPVVGIGAVVAAARAAASRGPGEIRACMRAVLWTAEDLRDLALSGLPEREYASRCVERAAEYLAVIDGAEARACEEADRARAFLAASLLHETVPELDYHGRVCLDLWRPLSNAGYALTHAERAVAEYHAAGMPWCVAEWTARCAEIEHRIELLTALTTGQTAVTAATIAMRRVWNIVRHGGVRNAKGKVSTTGVRKLRWDLRRAEAALADASESLWAPIVSEHEDRPIVIALRGLYEEARARFAEAPTSLPTDPKSLEQLRRRVPQWSVPPIDWRAWCERMGRRAA